MENDAASEVVKAEWKHLTDWLTNNTYEGYTRLVPLVIALSQDPRASQFYPIISHLTLALVRNTQYPFMCTGISATALGKGKFRAFGPNNKLTVGKYEHHRWFDRDYEILGEGDLEYVVCVVSNGLPDQYCSAIVGPADNVRLLDDEPLIDERILDLHMAVLKTEVYKIESLLAQGLDIDSSNCGQETPLMIAVTLNNLEMANFLLSRGANTSHRDADGLTALGIAEAVGTAEMADLLRQHGSKH
jgi:hypothetical protein